jgi:hypothetical protein
VNLLSKEFIYSWVQPPDVLQVTPGYSFVTLRYPTSQNQANNYNGIEKVTINPVTITQPTTGEVILIPGSDGTQLLSYGGSSPIGNNIPPIRVVVNVPPSYSWIIPTPYYSKINNINWNGSAISKQAFINYGEVAFSIRKASVGILVGAMSTNDAAQQTNDVFNGYGFYIENGSYVIVNKNNLITTPKLYNNLDMFKIVISMSGVSWIVNNDVVYTIPEIPEKTSYNLKAILYTSYDNVVDASIKEVSYVNVTSTLNLSGNILSENYSGIFSELNLLGTIHPSYGINSTLNLSGNLYSEGYSGINSSLLLLGSIEVQNNIVSSLQLEGRIYHKDFSQIYSILNITGSITARGLRPVIPVYISSQLELLGSIRDRYIEDPTMFVIT